MSKNSKFESRSGHNCKGLVIKALLEIKSFLLGLGNSQGNGFVFLLVWNNLVMSEKRYPYKEAKLHIPGEDSKDQRWFIYYSAYSLTKGRLVKKKDYQLNRQSNLANRMIWANELIKQYNEYLAKGYCIDDPRLIDYHDNTNYNLPPHINLLDRAIWYKERKNLREKSLKSYRDSLSKYRGFLRDVGQLKSSVHEVGKDLMNQYKDYLLDMNLSGRTVNNHFNFLMILFNELREQELISENPMPKIRVKQDTKRNRAYNNSQISELLKFMEKKDKRFYFLSKFMYYTLFRTNEIAQLKIEHVNMNLGYIYLPAFASKNRRERYVKINSSLRELLEEMDLLKFEGINYLFGKGIKPGPEPEVSRYLGARYRENILIPLGYSTEYTLYSWKHTGVVLNYMAGMSKAALQMQIGHVSTESFDTYLRSLGLIDNNEIDNYVKLPD